MLNMEFKKLCIVLLLAFHSVSSLNILGVFPYNGKSHHIYFSALLQELAVRGHKVTVISHFPFKNPHKNVRDISLAKTVDAIADTVDMDWLQEGIPPFLRAILMTFVIPPELKKLALLNCDILMNENDVIKLINSGEKFDVSIVEQFCSDCGLALAHHFKAPVIGVTSHVLMPWTYARFGLPNHPAFVPNHFTSGGSTPDLLHTIQSAFINTYWTSFYRYVIQPAEQAIVAKRLPDTPHLEDLARNISLIMINEYFPLTGSRLLAANSIEIGGLHVANPKPLEGDLAKFIAGAKHGVVLVSFGSVAKFSTLAEARVRELLALFGAFPQRFLLKWESDELPGAPANVMTRKWLPQLDILCDPNTRAFISHAGMLSTTEALRCGVPVVNVPLFGDQDANAASLRESGFGRTVLFRDFDFEHLQPALEAVLTPEWQAKAKAITQQWLDRPMSAMDTAVYWTEYIARYGGAALRPPTVHIPFYRYYLLDVIGSLLASAAVAIYLQVYTAKCIYAFLFKKAAAKVAGAKTKSKAKKKRD